MATAEIIKKLSGIFTDIWDDENILEVGNESLKNWNDVKKKLLIDDIDEEFSLQLSFMDIEKIRNISELAELIKTSTY